jgi:hypothetical protein
MPNVLRAGLVCLGLVLAATPAHAQGLTNFLSPGTRAATFSSGSAQTVVNTPIDTSLAIAPFPGQQDSISYITSFFHNISIPGMPVTNGVSPLPPPSSFPSTQYENFRKVPFTPINQESRFMSILRSITGRKAPND